MEPTMIEIPAGLFTMGVPEPPADFSLPHRWPTGKRVQVSSFSLSPTAITNAQYRVFLDDADAPANPWMDEPQYAADDQPVVNTNWHDAKAYCQWLAQKTGKPYRLPTDTEWEYAARGGSQDTVFPWGNELHDTDAWFGGQEAPKPVASYAPNGYGLYDMIGNVWQWCEDRFEDASGGNKAINTIEGDDPDPRDNRVLRGGSFLTTIPHCLYIAYRHEDPPALRHQCIGFRVACDS